MVPSAGEMQPSNNKFCTDLTNEMKQSLSDIIEISSYSSIDSAKIYDSQETISKEKRETGFFSKIWRMQTLSNILHYYNIKQNL